jgi:hypothetical protein
MEENSNKPNNPNPERKPGKKPYYKKRYNPQPQKRKFWNADKIVSLSAMSIALFTLAVLLYQSYILDRQYELTVKQQKAYVMPHLFMGQSYGSNYYKIIIQNKGLGPAFIKGLYKVENDSNFMIGNIVNLFEEFPKNSSDSLLDVTYSSLFQGVVIGEGDTFELISVEGNTKTIDTISELYGQYFTGDRDAEKFIVEYASVFEDAWVVESTYQIFTKEEYGEFESF